MQQNILTVSFVKVIYGLIFNKCWIYKIRLNNCNFSLSKVSHYYALNY